MCTTPLFIGGCSRSGTTLLASMLGASKEMLVIPESHFKVDLLRKIAPNSSGLYDSKKVAEYIQAHPRYKIWCCKEPLKFTREEMTLSDIMDEVAEHYGRTHYSFSFNSWIDHTPGNIEFAPILSLNFKDSKFIHIVRDGRGFAASVKKLDWGFHDMIVIGRYWRDNLIRDLTIEHALGDKVLRVNYESLVERPEENLKEICSFAGLKYSDEMLKADGFITPSYTKKQHSLIGKGVNSNRSNAWKKSLSKREIELFESVSKPILKELNYKPEFENPSNNLSLEEVIKFKFRNFYYKHYDAYKRKNRLIKNSL